MKFARILVLLMAFALAAIPASAQDEEVVKINSELVSFEVSVRDAQGLPIKGLTADDFIVYEDGKQQQLSFLSSFDSPLDLVLVIDTSLSTQQEIGLMRDAARRFITGLAVQDRVAIVQFSRDVVLLTDFTDDRSRLQGAIEQVGTYASNRSGSSVYDAMSLVVSKELLGKRQSRRAVLMITDGVDTSSIFDYEAIKFPVEQAGAGFYFIELDTEKSIENAMAAQKSDPKHLVFAPKQLRKFYLNYPKQADDPIKFTNHWLLSAEERRNVNRGLYELARRELRDMAERTGGQVFVAKTIEQIDAQLRAMLLELRTLYSIGYYPGRSEPDGQFHKLKVELKSGAGKLRYRNGYIAKRK